MHTPKALFFAFVGVSSAIGCAQVIGASFDGMSAAPEASAPAPTATTPAEAAPPPPDAAPSALEASSTVDAPPDVVPDVAPPPPSLDPSTVADLELWLAADKGVEVDVDAGVNVGDAAVVGPGVSNWRDSSGHARRAFQTEPSKRPALVANAKGTKPAVHFDSARGSCLATDWTSGPTAPAITLFAVANGDFRSLVRFQGDQNLPALVFPYDPGSGRVGDFSFFVRGEAVGDASAPRLGLSTTDWVLAGGRFSPIPNGTYATFRNGDVVEQRLSSIAGVTANEPLFLGSAHCASDFADGDVAELLIVGHAVTEVERASIEAYLRYRWQLPKP